MSRQLLHTLKYSLPFVALVVSVLLKLELFDSWCCIERFSNWVDLTYNLPPSLIVACVCILPRQRRWSIVLTALVCILIDLWLIANILYFTENGLFVTWQVAQLIQNLQGFESSLLTLISWKLLLLPCISLSSIVLLAILPYHWSAIRCTLYTIIILGAVFLSARVRYNHKSNDAPFSIAWFSLTTTPDSEQAGIWALEYNEITYMHMHSIMDLFVKFCWDAFSNQPKIDFNENELLQLDSLIGKSCNPRPTQGPLVFILVESMEGWILNEVAQDGTMVCPNINKWIHNHPSIVSDKVISQKRYGESGDGQLICMTGLLPINDGATCNLYGANVYPNWAHFYEESAIINPCTYLWNQNVVTYSYGFKTLLAPRKEEEWWTDSIVFENTKQFIQQSTSPCCVLAITVDSHKPYLIYDECLQLDNSISDVERHYINCFHHIDAEIGHFLEWADTTKLMQNATIVITGDHYASYEGIGNHPKYMCALVLSSPQIKETLHIGEVYQMDLFPTILDAIEQPYYWRGFGKSLLNDSLINIPRTMSVDQAYILSDKMIRTNYFERYSK